MPSAPWHSPNMIDMTFRMKTGRFRSAGVERKNKAMVMGTKKEDEIAPISRKLSDGSMAAM